VCLAKSRYFYDKLHSLSLMFNGGCFLVNLAEPEAARCLREAMNAAWEAADSLRPGLLESAEAQCRVGDSVFRKVREKAPSGGQDRRGVRTESVICAP
jgi:hypothetical protein